MDFVRLQESIAMVAKIMKAAKGTHIGTMRQGVIQIQKWKVGNRGVIVEITDKGDVNHFIVSETNTWFEMREEMLALSKKGKT